MFDFQAHRGGRDARPENTLYSYLYGMEIGANIECDMQLARDGIVMSHNPVLNRGYHKRYPRFIPPDGHLRHPFDDHRGNQVL